MNTNDDLKIGDVVAGLLWHTGVIVADADTNNPVVETWGYGRGLGQIPRNQFSKVNVTEDMALWFKKSVDHNVRRFGPKCLPTHDVSKDLYIKGCVEAERGGPLT
jgi:hypothetical protein